MTAQARRARGARWRLYAIVDPEVTGLHPDSLVIAERALAGGAEVVQLRDKRGSGRAMLTLARGLRARTHTLGADFIVNDRLDVALAAEADGVHLGQDDLPADVARTLMGPEAIVGVSTHSVAEAQAAREAGADYVGVGAMYESPTKPGSRVVGPAMVTTVKRVTGLPVVAIGGITEANAQGVVAAGADALAIIGVLADANDPALAAGRLRAAVGRGRGGK